jgi:putative ABC transport system permease protein
MWFPSRRDPRVRDEIRFHRDRLIEDYMAAGMNRAEAERRAFLEFGNAPQIEEAVRDVRGRWLDDFWRDLRYAVRTLGRNRGFATVAVLSLALGIGANAAIFSLINAVMLRTLPVREPDRLVQISRWSTEGRPHPLSYRLFEYFRDNVSSFSGAFAQSAGDQAIAIDGDEDFVTAELVSGAYYSVLGIEPEAGRLLGPADDVLSPSLPAAVISDRFWQRRFDRSPSAIGKAVTIRDRIFTIVGVTPPSFQSARAGHHPDIALPLGPMMSEEVRTEITNNWLSVLGRLKPGATVEQANAEVQLLWSSFLQSQASKARQQDRAGILRARATAFPSPDGINPFRYDHAQSLLILMGIVGLVLLLACVNLSGLLFARAAARQREVSIRLAIGAGRGRLVRQLLTESLLLAAIGGTLGLVLAGWCSERLMALFLNGSSVTVSAAPDWRVFAFTAVVALLACVVAGLAPALHAVRFNVNPALKEARVQGSRWLGKSLVVAQLAISMILVVGATLFLRTLVNLYSVERGFNSDGVLVVNVRSSRPYEAARGFAVQSETLERLKGLPGILSASAAQVLPIGGGLWTRGLQVEGYTFRADEPDSVGFNVIAPDYFRTVGTPLIYGREFDDRDTGASPRVAIVNESFARYFFGDAQALGRRVTSLKVTYEIVGVVRDAKYQNLRQPIIKTMYISWLQRDGDQPTRYNYLARVGMGDPMRLTPGLERLVREVDPSLRVRTTLAYATLVDRSIATERIMATLGGFFGVLALIVAAIGLFGLLAFQVSRRTNELGVRMALGATRRAMIGLVLRDVVGMVVAGILIGIIVALTLSGLARSTLFGVTPTDPAAFVTAAFILGLTALFAGWFPARRAARVDPLIALRHE